VIAWREFSRKREDDQHKNVTISPRQGGFY